MTGPRARLRYTAPMSRAGVLALTIQRRTDAGWPIAAELRREGELPLRREALLRLDLAALAGHTSDYGRVLGEALFAGPIGEAWTLARARCPDRLHLGLRIDDPDLRALRWDALQGPIDGGFTQLRLDQRIPLALEVASESERSFPALAPDGLRALVLVTSPTDLDAYGMTHFDTLAALHGAREAIAPIPCDVLAFGIPDAVGPPTLEALCARLTARDYAILHIVCHGTYARNSRETVLYLADDDETTAPVPASKLLQRLGRLGGEVGLPHLVFLCACETALPEAEGALGGLGHRLVRELGLPAVVAMTDRISVDTASALVGPFYRQLAAHGLPDLALAEASTQIVERRDIAAPLAFVRAAGVSLLRRTGLKEHVAALPAPDAPPPLFAASRLPLSLGPRFVGRDADLAALLRELAPETGPRADGLAVVAPAGFGKTRLALELVWRHRGAFPGGVFWLSAAAPEHQAATFHLLLTQLDPDAPALDVLRARGESPGPRLAAALRAFRPGRAKLWVIEDIPEPAEGAPAFELQSWCPAWGDVAVVALSRATLPDADLPHHTLGPLAPDDAVALLRASSPLDPALARRLAEWVGGMPLALELLGKSLGLGDLNEADLRELVDRGSVSRVLGEAESVLSSAAGGPGFGLLSALRASYHSLAPDARRLARLLAQLGPEPLPMTLVKAFGPDAARPARAALVARSFVTGLSGQVFGTMHRVLADFLRELADGDEPARARDVLAGLLTSDALQRPQRWPELSAWAAHADALLFRLPGGEQDVALALGVGRHYLNVDRNDAGLRVEQRAVELARGLPPDNPYALIAPLMLAAAHHQRGDHRQALALQERSLADAIHLHGEHHPLTATSQRALAGTLRDVGQRRRALELYDTLVDRWRAELGRDDTETLSLELGRAITLLADDELPGALAAAEDLIPRIHALGGADEGLALLAGSLHGNALLGLGRLADARAALESTHAAALALIGPDHGLTLDLVDGLALVLHGQGELVRARDLAAESLPRHERLLGPDHPQTFVCRHILSRLEGDLGNWPRALVLARQTAEAAIARFGDRHPIAIQLRLEVGIAALEVGELREARAALLTASDLLEVSAGPEHPTTLRARAALAYLSLQAGNPVRAREQFAALAAASAHRLGDDHPETLVLRNNLGLCMISQGDAPAALALFGDLVLRSRSLLGDQHPLTLLRSFLLSRARLDAGDLVGALPLAQTNLADMTRVLGPEHPDTLAQRTVLAGVLRATGQPGPGEAHARAALAGLRARQPAGHVTIRDALLALGLCLSDQDRIDEAHPLLVEVEPMLVRHLGEEHPSTCSVRFDLAAIELRLGRPEPAAARLAAALPAFARTWGPDSLYVLLAEHNLALAESRLGRLPDALARLEALVPRAQAALGDHPSVAGFARNLALLRARAAAPT